MLIAFAEDDEVGGNPEQLLDPSDLRRASLLRLRGGNTVVPYTARLISDAIYDRLLESR